MPRYDREMRDRQTSGTTRGREPGDEETVEGADPDPEHREAIETVTSSLETEPASAREVAKARSEAEDVHQGAARADKAAHDPLEPSDPTDPTEPAPR